MSPVGLGPQDESIPPHLRPARIGVSAACPDGFTMAPGEPLRHRHEVLALMAAYGAANSVIASELKLTQSRVSILLSDRKIKDRIAAYRGLLFADINARIQKTAPKAMDFFDGVIAGTEEAKSGERLAAATWILEKTTGKPKQELEVTTGHSIRDLLLAAAALSARPAASPSTVLSSEREAASAPDEVDTFLAGEGES